MNTAICILLGLCLIIEGRVNHIGVDLMTNEYRVRMHGDNPHCDWIYLSTEDHHDNAHDALLSGDKIQLQVNIDDNGRCNTLETAL